MFQELITQGGTGLVRGCQPRSSDATHVLANIAVPTTLVLVAQASDGQLLDAALPYAPERVSQEEAEVIRLRTATADLPDAERGLAQRTLAHLRGLWPGVAPARSSRRLRIRPGSAAARQALDVAHGTILGGRTIPNSSEQIPRNGDVVKDYA